MWVPKTTKRASHSFPNSLVTELLGDDTVIGDPLVVKAYQERMSDYTVNSYQVRQGKTDRKSTRLNSSHRH